MTLTILQSGTYDLSLSTDSPATTLMTMDPSMGRTPSPTNTPSTWAGFTARTIRSVSATTSAAVPNMRIP